MSRTRCAPLLALLLVFACGGGDPQNNEAVEVSSGGEAAGAPAAAAPQADLFAYLPDGAFGVGIARVDTLRQSPYWAPLADMLRQGAPVGAGFEEAVLSFLDRTERVAFCVHSERRADLGWIFLQGDFQDGEFMGLLERAVPEVSERPFVESTLAGYRTFTQRDVIIVQLDSSSLLFGPTEVVTAELLERGRTGHRHSMLSDPRFTAMAQRVGLDNAGMAFVGVATEASRVAFDRELDDFGAPAGSVEVIGVRGDAAAGVVADIVMVTNDPTVAGSIVQRLQAEQVEAAGSMPVRAVGLGGVVESVVVEAQGADVVVAARADDATIQGLFDRFRSVAVLGMRAMAADREAREARRQERATPPQQAPTPQ